MEKRGVGGGTQPPCPDASSTLCSACCQHASHQARASLPAHPQADLESSRRQYQQLLAAIKRNFNQEGAPLNQWLQVTPAPAPLPAAAGAPLAPGAGDACQPSRDALTTPRAG